MIKWEYSVDSMEGAKVHVIFWGYDPKDPTTGHNRGGALHWIDGRLSALTSILRRNGLLLYRGRLAAPYEETDCSCYQFEIHGMARNAITEVIELSCRLLQMELEQREKGFWSEVTFDDFMARINA